MQPVPARVVKSYNVRFQLQTLIGPNPPGLKDAVDLHAHAQTGTENPLSMAKNASRAGMGSIVFKNLPTDRPPAVTRHEVEEQLKRWCEAEDLAPVQCLHGAQTDPMPRRAGVRASAARGGRRRERDLVSGHQQRPQHLPGGLPEPLRQG
jgi:hypothetical protein